MSETMTPYDLIVAAGLDPARFATKAWAPQPDDGHPALVSGTLHGGVFVVIRAWQIEDDAPQQHEPFSHHGWIAVAMISKNPHLTVGELSPEEAERLRAETLTPQGAAKPVGQTAVLGRSDPKPYAPPLDTAESVHADTTAAEIEEDIGAAGPIPVPLPCGTECVQLKGPEGTQDYHGADCSR